MAASAAGQVASQIVRALRITDAQIYDDGCKQPVADAVLQAADEHDALTWALSEINARVSTPQTMKQSCSGRDDGR